jgi:hypothetical protein
MANSRVYEGLPESEIDFPLKVNHKVITQDLIRNNFQFEKGYITLANRYPQWTKMTELGLGKTAASDLVKLLFENCLLLVKNNSPEPGKDNRATPSGTSKLNGQSRKKKTNKKKHQHLD